ncbi:MAG: DUF3352 domain-containing protein, partial [Actinomycetota bacterium]|nr:DUF3352 domain-containing protein [Actinomycetota bacterium]
VNIEAGTDPAERASTVGARTPLLTEQVLAQVQPFLLGAAGEPPNFARDIEPWFGGEIAIAVVPGGAGTEQVQMLEVADAKGARDYESSIGAGAPEPDEYQGTEIREDQRGLATAIVDDFLVIGSADGVRSVADVAAGADAAEPLSEEPTVEQAIDELPADSFAQGYLSTEGIDSFLALSRGALAPFEPFVDSGASQGAAFSLGADEEGYLMAIRSVLDPGRSEDAGGFFAAFAPFEPMLPAEIAPDTLAYLGFGDADETVDALLAQATIRAPGIAKEVTDLADRLRKEAGVDLTEELLPALDGEGAVAVTPRPQPSAAGASDPSGEELPGELGAQESPERVQPGQTETPYLQFVAGGVDEEEAAEALARLQKEFAQSVDPNIANPVFREQAFGDVTAQVLRRSPASVLAYAIADEKLVLADDTAPIERLDGDPDSGLAGAEGYEAATDGLAEDPSLIAYLDLSGLVAAAERLGAGAESPFTTFAEDLRRLQTFALTVGTEDDVLASDARLRIAAP